MINQQESLLKMGHRFLQCHPAGCDGAPCREVPDVSASADPYNGYAIYVTAHGSGCGGWCPFGGTSGGSPLWSALVALIFGISGSAGAVTCLLTGAGFAALGAVISVSRRAAG